MLSVFILFSVSFFIVLILTPLIRNLSIQMGLVDLPNEPRKMHKGPIPRVGGVAIAIGYLAAYGILILVDPDALSLQSALPAALRLVPSAALILLTGVLDDIFNLSPKQKLIGQITAAGLAFWVGGIRISSFAGYPIGDALSLVLTLIWLIGSANAFNLIDGMDGLAAGIGLFATCTIVCAGFINGDMPLLLATVPLVGALIGFIGYNFPPASIFLGDSGSLFIGFLLGCYSVTWSQKSVTLIGMVAPLMTLSIPLVDTGLALVRRFLRNRPLFHGDRDHLHHRVLDRGLKPVWATMVFYAFCIFGSGLALMLMLGPSMYALPIVLLFAGVLWASVQALGYFEFTILKRLVARGTVRHLLGSEIEMFQLRQSLISAPTPEKRWTLISEACLRSGFEELQACMNGQVFEHRWSGPKRSDCWEMRITLSSVDYVILRRSFDQSSSTLVGDSLVDAIRAGISVTAAHRATEIVFEDSGGTRTKEPKIAPKIAAKVKHAAASGSDIAGAIILCVALAGIQPDLSAQQVTLAPAQESARAFRLMVRTDRRFLPQPVAGPVTFTVQTGDLPQLAAVEYQINGWTPPGGVIGVSPYELNWNTAWAWNGQVRVEAVARNAAGQEIARSAPVQFTVANGPAQMQLVSPVPQAVLSGTERWQVAVQGGAVEGVMFLVDGQTVDTLYVNGEPGIDLDTTRFSNGWHELFAGAHSLQGPLAMSSVRVRFENGRTLQDLLARWRDVFLLPGETTQLDPRWLYTNGDDEPALTGVRFDTMNPNIATVSETGEVHGVAPGVTTIALSGGGRETTTRVIVNQARVFPHFSKQGGVLTQYDPAKSTLVRTLFHLEVNEAISTPGLREQLKAASVNTISSGFYPTLSDIGNPTDIEGFKRGWDPMWTRMEGYAQQEGFQLMLLGDNIARGPEALWGALYQPWSEEALKYAFGRARDSRCVVSLEMVDESSGVWGDTPRPEDGRWLTLNPPIPDHAIEQLMGVLKEVPNRTPVSWPILWLSGLDAARNWMGNASFSDYASNYWDNNQWRAAYPRGLSLPQIKDSIDNVVVKRYPVMQRDKPAIQLISIAGPYYTKLTAGEEYTPGQDRLQSAGLPPVSVAAQAMYGLAMGMSGLRAYAYDGDAWARERIQHPLHSPNLQTGADPFRFGTDRWQAMSSAFQLTAELEEHFLQPQIHALELGPQFVTGARQGPQGRVLIAINLSERTVSRHVNLSSYLWSGATAVKRYRLVGGKLSSQVLPASAMDTVIFEPGETMIWLMQPQALSDTLAGVAIQSPVADSTVAGRVAVQAAFTGSSADFELLLDGRVLEHSAIPSFSWDSTTATQGIWHSLTIRATNAAGVQTIATIGVMPVPAPADQDKFDFPTPRRIN